MEWRESGSLQWSRPLGGSERKAVAGSGAVGGAWGEASPRSVGFAGASRPLAGQWGCGFGSAGV